MRKERRSGMPIIFLALHIWAHNYFHRHLIGFPLMSENQHLKSPAIARRGVIAFSMDK